jgi:hypothetical protein
MACTITATAKSATANSYSTIADADTYHESHPYAETWDNATDDEKCRALVTATRLLDVWFDWFGHVTTLTQALLWPRRGVHKPGISDVAQDSGSNDWNEPFGVLLDPDVIPVRIRDAVAELARQLLDGDRTADSDQETQNLRALRVGPVALDFGTAVAKPIPDSVMVMVSALGRPRNRTGSGAIHMYRG